MDAKFHPAIAAIRSGDLETFKALVSEDPTLATSRSSTSHPTLLQCVVLDGKDKPNNVEMARVLIEVIQHPPATAGGSDKAVVDLNNPLLNEPLGAAASINNPAVAELLLDHGAAIDGDGGWSPLEEALYWDSRDVIALLLERGAAVQNIRMAAGLGRTDLIEDYFNDDGSLKPEAGKINWPWGGLETIACSNHAQAGKEVLAARVNEWSQDQQGTINNAFVYACMHGHIEAAKLLLQHGAEINVVPGGFDYAGTGLHYAALNGRRAMVEFLLQQGADREVKDTKVGSDAAGWAEHSGQLEIRDLLRGK
jgi:ankyrin repeat protein